LASKSRGIYGNYLRLPRLILACGGTQAAIPYIPAAKPVPAVVVDAYAHASRSNLNTRYLDNLRELKQERQREPRWL